MSDTADAQTELQKLFSPADWRRILREITTYNWSKRSPKAATLCLPPIAIWLFVAIDTHYTHWAIFAVAGTFTTALGAFQKLGATRTAPMLLLLVGMAIMSWIGNIAGHLGWYWPILVATTAGFSFGALTLLGYGGWWLGLQWMIALLVYGSHASTPLNAAKESLAMLAGGASQLLFLTATMPFTAAWFSFQDQPAFDTSDSLAHAFFQNIYPAHHPGKYALRVATAMFASTAIAHFWHLPNSYWIAMTAVILLKPNFHDATLRGISRLIGTLLGAGLTTLLIAWIKPNHTLLSLLILASIWSCLTLLRVNYSLFVTCVTAYVVLLFAMLGLPGSLIALHRLEATLIGATIALLVSLIPAKR